MQDSGPAEITVAGPGITLSGDTTMKRTLISLAGLLVTASLVAATEQPAAPRTTTTAPDSPLVAAAKKTKRTGKTRIVITDDSVKNAKGGHLSTTKIQSNIFVAEPQKSTEQVMAETKAKEKERAAERAKLAKAAAEEKQKKIARAVAAAEDDGPYEVDPATVEHQMNLQTSTASTPTSSQPQPSKHDDTQRP